MVSLLPEQFSHLVVAQRTVAASMREQWFAIESDAERDGVREEGRARGGDTEREREGVVRERIREGSLN